jgi:hypothetical protein
MIEVDQHVFDLAYRGVALADELILLALALRATAASSMPTIGVTVFGSPWLCCWA